MDTVTLGVRSVRLIAAGSEHGVAGERSSAHAHLVRAVAANACTFVRASLHGALLELRPTADGRKQVGCAALAAHAEGVLTEPDYAGSRLVGCSTSDGRTCAKRKSFDCRTLKTR